MCFAICCYKGRNNFGKSTRKVIFLLLLYLWFGVQNWAKLSTKTRLKQNFVVSILGQTRLRRNEPHKVALRSVIVGWGLPNNAKASNLSIEGFCFVLSGWLDWLLADLLSARLRLSRFPFMGCTKFIPKRQSRILFCFCPTTALLASNLRLGENKNKSPQFLADFCAKLCRGD